MINFKCYDDSGRLDVIIYDEDDVGCIWNKQILRSLGSPGRVAVKS